MSLRRILERFALESPLWVLSSAPVNAILSRPPCASPAGRVWQTALGGQTLPESQGLPGPLLPLTQDVASPRLRSNAARCRSVLGAMACDWIESCLNDFTQTTYFLFSFATMPSWFTARLSAPGSWASQARDDDRPVTQHTIQLLYHNLPRTRTPPFSPLD